MTVRTESWRRLAGRVSVATLLVAVAVAAVPYGAMLPAARVRMEVLAGIALLLAALSDSPSSRLRRFLLPILLLCGIVALGLTQLAPLPLVSTLSPASAAAWDEAARLLALSGDTATPTPRISIAPVATTSVLLLVGSYVAAAVTAILVLDTRRRRQLFVATIVGAGLAHLGYGVILDRGTAGERVHGTFVNPNHLAGYLTIALFVALAALLTSIARRPSPHRRDGVVRAWVVGSMFALLWATFAGGLAITKSRGALLASASVTLVVLVSWSALSSSRRRIAAAWVAALAAVLLLALALGSEPLLRFLSSDPREIGADTRVVLWSTSIETWKEYPIFGAGLGAFRDAYRPHQPTDLDGLVEQAHSEPLQIAVTGGWVGLLLATAVMVSTLVLLVRGAALQRMREERALALCAAGAVTTLLLHGIVEFNFSVPAIPFTLAALCGTALAATIAEPADSQ